LLQHCYISKLNNRTRPIFNLLADHARASVGTWVVVAWRAWGSKCVAWRCLARSAPQPLSASVSRADPTNWSGFSVSVGGGAAQTDTSLDVDTVNKDRLDLFIFPPPLFSFIGQALGHSGTSEDDWHGFGTIQAGYDQRIGNFVVGGFADFDFYPDRPKDSTSNNINGNLSFAFFNIPIGPVIPIANYASVTSSVELQNTWSVGGRIGYLVTPDVLLYGLGGYTQARFDGQINLSYLSLTAGPQTLSLNVPDELRGYFVGAGGEAKIAHNVALRLEYRYANYSGETNSASASSGAAFLPFVSYTNSASVQASLDEQIHTVRAALVLKLGEP
jgi:opacity protein-like surface antigen